MRMVSLSRATYGQLLNLCVWNKSNAGMGSLYRSRHELVFVYRVGSAPHFNAVELGKHDRNRTNVWDYASVNSMRGRVEIVYAPSVVSVSKSEPFGRVRLIVIHWIVERDWQFKVGSGHMACRR